MPHASIVLRNARIYTLVRTDPWAEALAIVGDRIAWVGPDTDAAEWVGPNTQVIDAGRRLVLPGLIDSHFHLLMGARTLRDLKLDDARNVDEVQSRLRAFAQAHPEREWLTGRGWQHSLFARGGRPERAALDAVVPDRPVYLVASDGHSAWANTAALQRAGILNGPPRQPTFGAVVMGEDGLATGELREAAMSFVRDLIPPLPRDEEDDLLRQALRACAEYGITSVHNMDGDAQSLAVYRDFEARGELTLRIYVPLTVEPGTPEAAIEAWAHDTQQTDRAAIEARPTPDAMPLVRTGCVKLFADGVIESKTAWLLEPYDDGSGECGRPNFDPDEFKRLVTKADALKLQIFVHAIGDAAVRAALDAFNLARRLNQPRDARHRLEHIELLDPVDLTRMKRQRVLASVQPLHAEFGSDPDNPWRRLVGPRRWAWGFPWRAILNAGVPMAFGSDWPVVTMNPFEGMRAALTRPKLDFSDARSHFPDHRLTLEELIFGYTLDGAFFEFQERHKGRIKPGMLADLAVLDTDLFNLPRTDLESGIAGTRSALTIVGGRIVHRALA
ncbi:MAG: amidohydrolase [Thermoflexales bacterium]|nr:amidohydrolase [Thermoflexales bacterium]MDW8352185.1 amidohydrolase [Anaerolineae bacterium]